MSAKQKKEVKAIAKSFAGKPGTPGAAGTNGTNGKDGAPGAKGENGTNGTPGADGKSVALLNDEPPACPNEEGFTYEVEGSGDENEVCRGPEGSPWTLGGTLPSNRTETGTWSATIGPLAFAYVGLSFPIQLAAGLDAAHVKFMDAGDPAATPGCTGGTPAEPTADPGYLCVYTGASVFSSFEGSEITKPSGGAGTGVSGAVYAVEGAEADTGYGTYAVTAP